MALGLKHLPGKHDQRTHGHGGGGKLSTISDEQYRTDSIAIRENLSATDRYVLSNYVHDSRKINDSLRAGEAPKGFEESLPILDSIVAKNSLPQGIVTYRSAKPSQYAKLKKGDVFTDKGFTSVSLRENIATSYGGKLLVEAHLPAGTKAIPMYNLHDREYVVARGTKYKVTARSASRMVIEAVTEGAKALSFTITGTFYRGVSDPPDGQAATPGVWTTDFAPAEGFARLGGTVLVAHELLVEGEKANGTYLGTAVGEVEGYKYNPYRDRLGRFAPGPSAGGLQSDSGTSGLKRQELQKWEGRRRGFAKSAYDHMKPHEGGFVLRDAGESVAICHVTIDSTSKSLVVEHLATKRSGYGKQAMQEAARHAADRGFGLTLTADPQAIGFYRHLGMKESASQEHPGMRDFSLTAAQTSKLATLGHKEISNEVGEEPEDGVFTIPKESEKKEGEKHEMLEGWEHDPTHLDELGRPYLPWWEQEALEEEYKHLPGQHDQHKHAHWQGGYVQGATAVEEKAIRASLGKVPPHLLIQVGSVKVTDDEPLDEMAGYFDPGTGELAISKAMVKGSLRSGQIDVLDHVILHEAGHAVSHQLSVTERLPSSLKSKLATEFKSHLIGNDSEELFADAVASRINSGISFGSASDDLFFTLGI